MAGKGSPGTALRAGAGVLVAALVGTGAVWAVFEMGDEHLDWIVFSNPSNICRFDHSPLCTAREYAGLGVRIAVAVTVAGLPIWAVLGARGRASLPNLMLAWAAAGFLIKLGYDLWLLGRFVMPPPAALIVLAVPALLAALIAAVMAMVFRLVVGE